GFPIRKSCILILNIVCASLPEAGAQCNSLARWDLCGGLRVTSVPTATGDLCWLWRSKRRPVAHD
ncbi:MAG: hypothetical protein NT018_09265, partial [Armatimonadetes bacterium]|nr:hypothetical protein [Armatimonadota bacterium]